MPPKKKIAPPIDRPLAKGYLREFSGWSTEYPPGLSEPNSLRLMENVWISREGAARIRPGLNSIFEPDYFLDSTDGLTAVGTFEHFWIVMPGESDARKAILFAVREDFGGGEKVGFRVATYDRDTHLYTVHTLTECGFEFPATTPTEEALAFEAGTTYVRYLQIDNKVLALSNAGESVRMFWVGSSPRVSKIQAIERPAWNATDKLTVIHPNTATITSPATKTAAVPQSDTLISSTAANNIYGVGYWYTFTNEIGESAPSQVTVVKVQRRWTGWKWNAPSGANSQPGGAETLNAGEVADQLIAYVPAAVYADAIAKGAQYLNLYMTTWSDHDPVPVDGVLVESKLIDGLTYNAGGWIKHTPAQADYSIIAPLPSVTTRRNYSDPPRAAQGIVAGDRMVLVNDRREGAVVRWTSNQQGKYTDFTANQGGGYKTLTTGNLYIPACVKLWQNPQSVDTLTILCLGADGYSTGFYMAPAEVSGLTENMAIMAFEETTATPGTVSPYGCEVVNNALYHPLEEQLMKSTANNYNISHKEMTAQIRNKWVDLHHKSSIISCEHDGRIWYLVHHLDGEPLAEHCQGNEIWVLDTVAEGGTWSRFLVQGIALRKIELNDKIHMAVVKPDGIYIFNVEAGLDDVQHPSLGTTQQLAIPWLLETNIQGANRAHDAWCHLQQLEIQLGNFQGSMEYGVKGWTLNGKPLDVSKVVRDLEPSYPGIFPKSWDLTDYLRVQYAGDAIKEWRFYANSVIEEGVHRPSYGQINTIQYRFTPVSVNVGYEYGSVETFEYGRVVADSAEQLTDSGTPTPFIDTRRP